MPIPNHCAECDKPLGNTDGWVCEACQEKEKEQEKRQRVYTGSTGEPMDWLPSSKGNEARR